MKEREEWEAPKLVNLDLKNTAAGNGTSFDGPGMSSFSDPGTVDILYS